MLDGFFESLIDDWSISGEATEQEVTGQFVSHFEETEKKGQVSYSVSILLVHALNQPRYNFLFFAIFPLFLICIPFFLLKNVISTKFGERQAIDLQ